MSRLEEILISKILGIPYDKPPQSRLEKLLMDSLNADDSVDADQWAGIKLLTSKIEEMEKEILDIRDNALTMDNIITLYPEFRVTNDGNLYYTAVPEGGVK